MASERPALGGSPARARRDRRCREAADGPRQPNVASSEADASEARATSATPAEPLIEAREAQPALGFTLQALSGDSLRLAGYRGQGGRAQLLGDVVRAFADEMGVNYPIVMAGRALTQQYGGIPALPTTFVIDKEGRIRGRITGLASRGRLPPLVRPLLAEQSASVAASKRGGRSALSKAGLYLVGIVTTYSVLGVAAAFTGRPFGSWLQSPWLLAGIGLLMLALALSMFGAYALQMPPPKATCSTQVFQNGSSHSFHTPRLNSMSTNPSASTYAKYFLVGCLLAVAGLGVYTLVAGSPQEDQQRAAASMQGAPAQGAPAPAATNRAARSGSSGKAAPDGAASGAQAALALPGVTVYKSPTCGCCAKWVEHMQAAGFEVQTVNQSDVTPKKNELGVPTGVRSCHTATVGDYAIEGHVPAGDVKRLLAEQPGVAGLAVPGMPTGSPGMEMPGRAPQSYQVYAFDSGRATGVFAQH